MMEKRNISISSKNGYSLLKVKLAKQYLDEIGSNKRNFDFNRLVEMYNDIQKFYNYGKLTLINNGLATEADFENGKEEEAQPIENAENRIQLGSVPEPSEALKEDKVEDTKEEVKKSVGRPKKAKE